MFIATCAVGCVKLRRSGMNGTGDHDQADLSPCRSDGAFPPVESTDLYKQRSPHNAQAPPLARRSAAVAPSGTHATL